MIKILQFVESLNRGGIESFVINVFHAIDHTKFEIIFLVLKEQSYDFVPELLQHNAKIYYLVQERNINSYSYLKGYHYNQLLRAWIIKHKKEFDIVHIEASHLQNMLPYIITFRLCKVDNIVLHSHNSIIESKSKYRIHQLFKHFLPFMHVEQIACSRAAGEWMFGLTEYNVINNGISLKRYRYSPDKRRSIRNQLGLQDHEVALFNAGRFSYQKNQSFLLRVLQNYLTINPNVKLFLAGTGGDLAVIKQLGDELGITQNIVFLGVRDDVDYLLNGMDCFLLPSRFEGLSVVAVEAQANGLPIIVSDCISIETKLCNFFYSLPITENVQTYQLWIDQICKIIKIGRNGILYNDNMQHYDISYSVHQLENTYTNILNKVRLSISNRSRR